MRRKLTKLRVPEEQIARAMSKEILDKLTIMNYEGLDATIAEIRAKLTRD